MTIVVGVAAPDGLILAADSRTTLTLSGGKTRVGTDSAQKVFAVCGSFGVACYGAAFVQDKTIAGQMDEFEAQFEVQSRHSESVDELAQQLGSFFQDRMIEELDAAGTPWSADQDWALGFVVAGYDSNGIGRLMDVRVPATGGPALFPSGPTTSNMGATWRGQYGVINRLMGGVDSDALAKSSVSVPAEVKKALSKLEYKLLPPLAIQDAIDCATFLIQTTIDIQRFCDGIRAEPAGAGVPSCGGPIRILQVGRDGVEWVSRPLLTDGTRRSAEGAI